MTRSTHRAAILGVLVGVALLGPGLSAAAQTETSENTRIAIIKGHDVYVRCGAAESYYPFTKLNDGDFVKVTGTKYEWSRVSTVGPAFDHAFGFVKFAKAETNRFRMAPDGKSGVTLGKIDIIAPNMETSHNPKDSWKALLRLEADQTLRVIETIESDKDMILKVELPDSAFGWVSTAFLESTTPDQARQWTDALKSHTRAKAEAAKTASRTTSSTSPPTAKPSTPEITKMASGPITTAQEPVSTPMAFPDPAFVPATEDNAAPIIMGAGSDEVSPAGAAKSEEPKLPTWNELEAALKRLQREPTESAEVTPLRELYLDLAQRSAGDARLMKYALGRADQLQVWTDLQKKRSELDAIRNRAKMSADETVAVQKALESSAEYVAVGRVAASTIYDGMNLPKLLRVQDAVTGRTIAYLQPDEEYQVVNLIGNLVGIVGEKNYDGALRLNIVEPKRIDLLMPEDNPAAQATVPTDR